MTKFDYQLTEHARERITERDIPLGWIERVLFNPQRIEKDKLDTELSHAQGVIPENNNNVLVVIYNVTSSPIRVVSVFFDRRLKGKL